MSQLIIRQMRQAHCKRGPEVCEECQRMALEERICLLEIDPDDKGLVQRRVIEVELDGESVWREFDIVRVFADEQEARDYAQEHHLRDVLL